MDENSLKPRLLLHACCGVCSAYVPELLIPEFEVTVYYENSNIFPQEEYFRRLDATRTMARKHGLELIEPAHSPDDWEAAVRGREQDGENGPRCRTCINFRLDRTFAYARDNNFDWIATTLSVSRRKNTEMINEIGALLADRYGINFLGRDWKKQNGENLSQERAKVANIYRQNYCGCRYSMPKN